MKKQKCEELQNRDEDTVGVTFPVLYKEVRSVTDARSENVPVACCVFAYWPNFDLPWVK